MMIMVKWGERIKSWVGEKDLMLKTTIKRERLYLLYCNNIEIDAVKDKQKREEKLHRSFVGAEAKKFILSLRSDSEYRLLQEGDIIREREED